MEIDAAPKAWETANTVSKAQERVRAILPKYGLSYHPGGCVLGGSAGAPTRSLKEALEGGLSPEQLSRVQSLLDDSEPPFDSFPSERLRRIRVIQILERMKGRQALALLNRIASLSSESVQAREARAAANRMRVRMSLQGEDEKRDEKTNDPD